MLDFDKWREIGQTLMRHKLRTLLTCFGVFWGIFMLVILIGAGNGMKNGAIRNITFARNAVFLWSGITSMPYAGFESGRSIRFTNDDFRVFQNRPEFDVVSPVVSPGNEQGWGTVKISYRNKEVSFAMLGVYPQALKINPLEVLEGRYINMLDIRQNRKVVVLGRRVQEELLQDVQSVGNYVQINGVPFLVIGVFDSLSTGEDARNDVQEFHIPATTAQRTFNLGESILAFGLTPAAGHSGAEVLQLALDIVYDRHKIDPADRGAVYRFNLEEAFKEIESVFAGIATFNWLVALGTLGAGMVGVGNIMLISVKERTREIGIRKSVGARPASIVWMLIQETLVITFFAGYAGLVCGVFLVEGVGHAMQAFGVQVGFFDRPNVDFSAALAAIAVLLVSGLIAGLIPGIKATRVDPVVALRAT